MSLFTLCLFGGSHGRSAGLGTAGAIWTLLPMPKITICYLVMRQNVHLSVCLSVCVYPSLFHKRI